MTKNTGYLEFIIPNEWVSLYQSKSYYKLREYTQLLIYECKHISNKKRYAFDAKRDEAISKLNRSNLSPKNPYIDTSILLMQTRGDKAINFLYPTIKQLSIQSSLIEYIWRSPLCSLIFVTQESQTFVADTARYLRHIASCNIVRYHRFILFIYSLFKKEHA